MDTRQLKYFVAVCEFKNLSHAADFCNTAASALSHHISALEAELDTQLFVRKPRGMEPTAAGLKLLDYARDILGTLDAAISDLRNGEVEVAGNISIGMPYSVIRIIGAGLMRHVLEDYPKARMLIREGLSGVTYAGLRAGELEIALIYNPPVDSETSRIALLEEELFCIGHPSIVGTKADPIRLSDMKDLPLALLQSGSLLRSLVDRPGELAELEHAAHIQLASLAGTLAALKERLACTLAPVSIASEELASGELVARKVIDPTPLRTLYLVTPAAQRPTALRETLAGLIRDKVQSAVEHGDWHGARLL